MEKGVRQEICHTPFLYVCPAAHVLKGESP